MSKDERLVSVIVPVYNVAPYLCQCVDSILAQTLKSIEIILVDDGSVDGSGEICDQYANMDNRIRVIHQNNQGLGPARNTGIDAAKGQWIGFVDADDYIEPEMFSELLSAAVCQGAKVAICGYREEYGNFSRSCPTRLIEQIMTSEHAIRETLIEESFGCYAWNKLYEKALWENVRFRCKKEFYEDIPVIYKVLEKSERVAFISEKLYHYRQRAESLTHGAKFDRRRLSLFEHYQELMRYSQQRNHQYDDVIQAAVLLNSLRFYVEAANGQPPVQREVMQMMRKNVIQNRTWIHNPDIPRIKQAFLWLLAIGFPVSMLYQLAHRVKLTGGRNG